MTKKKLPSQRSRQPNFWGLSPPILIAHRGGAGLYSVGRHRRENTIEVFKAAKKLGYEYLELDVNSTADGKVVVMHVTTDRLEAIIHKPSAPNARKMQKLTHSDLKTQLRRDIPTLGDIFRAFPDTKFLIDSKTDEVVEPLAKEIIKAKAYDRVYLNSFYLHRVIRLQELLGNKVIYGLIVGRYPKILSRKLKALARGQYTNIGLTAIAMPYKFLNKNLIGLIHDQGLKILVWTPNTKAQISNVLTLNIDGIISDNIGLLKKIVSSRN